MKQEELILDYLKRNGSITPLEALSEFGCFRLSARIHDLRAKGHDIETVHITHKLPSGWKTWAEYKLKAAPRSGTPGNGMECEGATLPSQNNTNI